MGRKRALFAVASIGRPFPAASPLFLTGRFDSDVAPSDFIGSPVAYAVDLKIVPNKAEHSFDNKAAKRSVAFGRPWRKHPQVKAMLKKFPRTHGRAVPKAAR